MVDQLLKYGPWALVGGGLLFLTYMLARYGFRGAMFGGRIRRTFGEVPLSRLNWVSGVVRIHEIEGDGGSRIGIEVVQKGLLSHDATAITISRSDAAALLRMLWEALDALGMGSPADTTGCS